MVTVMAAPKGDSFFCSVDNLFDWEVHCDKQEESARERALCQLTECF